MPFVILGLLLSGPLSLYDVRKRFSAGISLFYSSSSGGIERALRQLVADGHVTVEDAADSRRRRKLYAVTPAGRRAWLSWMTAPVPASADSETTILARVFLAGRLEDTADRLAVLDAVRERAAADLDALRRLEQSVRSAGADVPSAARTAFDYQFDTLDFGVRAHALTLEWIDELRAKESR